MKILLFLLFAAACTIHAAPLKDVDLSHLTQEEYTNWAQAMKQECLNDKPQFLKVSDEILTKMLGLEKKPEGKGLFAVDPVFNMALLFALVASENKFLMSDASIENLKKECAYYVVQHIKDDTQKAMIGVIYATIYSKNEKLKGK